METPFRRVHDLYQSDDNTGWRPFAHNLIDEIVPTDLSTVPVSTQRGLAYDVSQLTRDDLHNGALSCELSRNITTVANGYSVRIRSEIVDQGIVPEKSDPGPGPPGPPSWVHVRVTATIDGGITPYDCHGECGLSVSVLDS